MFEKNKKEIILHVGLHKTGTSSIQLSCLMNKTILKKNGYFYPEFFFNDVIQANHSIPIYSLYSDVPEKYHINMSKGLRGQELIELNNEYESYLIETLKSQDKIIISGEDISVLSLDGLRKLNKVLASEGHRIKVICIIRNPYDFICSATQQMIKDSTGPETLFTLKKITCFKKSNDIERLLTVFGGKVEFYNYEDECRYKGGVVGAFYSRLSIDDYKLGKKESNIGLSDFTVRLLAYINSYIPKFKNGQLNDNYVQNKLPNLIGEKFRLTLDEFKSISDELEAEKIKIKELTSIDFNINECSVNESLSLGYDDAISIYSKYAIDDRLSSIVMSFIKCNAAFDLRKLLNYNIESAVFYRDLAIVLEDTDIIISKISMEKAFYYRKGPLIKEKLEKYTDIFHDVVKVSSFNDKEISSYIREVTSNKQITLKHPLLGEDTFSYKSKIIGMCNVIKFANNNKENAWYLIQLTKFVSAVFCDGEIVFCNDNLKVIKNVCEVIIQPEFLEIGGSDFKRFDGVILNQIRPAHYLYDQHYSAYNIIEEYPEVKDNFYLGCNNYYDKLPGIEFKSSNNESCYVFCCNNYNHNFKVINASESYYKYLYESAESKSINSDFVLWIGVTGQKRSWCEQVVGYANIINYFHDKYKSMTVIIDGWTSYTGGSGTNQDDITVFDEIKSLINPSVNVISVINLEYKTKIGYAKNIDLFISNAGGGAIVPLKICNKKGVVHSNGGFNPFNIKDGGDVNIIVTGGSKDGMFDDYSIDWKDILSLSNS